MYIKVYRYSIAIDYQLLDLGSRDQVGLLKKTIKVYENKRVSRLSQLSVS
jgi:hypothetical protein